MSLPGIRPCPLPAPAGAGTVPARRRRGAFRRGTCAARPAAPGRHRPLITGVSAHTGRRATAAGAFVRGSRPFPAAGAVAGFSRERHDRACGYAARRCAAVTITAGAPTALPAPIPAGVTR